MSDPAPRPSIPRLLGILVLGAVLGHFGGVFLYFLLPKSYHSEALLRESTYPGRAIDFPRAHAAIVVENLALHMRWNVPFDDAIDDVVSRTTLVTGPDGTRIQVRAPLASDARLIATEIADTYPGLAAATAWAAHPGPVHPFNENERATLQVMGRLRTMMIEDLAEAGVRPGLDAPDDPRTVAAMTAPDFQRRLAALESLASPPGRFAAPGAAFSPPPFILLAPRESLSPDSPDIDGILSAGRWTGLIFALVALLLIHRRRPEMLAATPSGPVPRPAWAAESAAARTPPEW